MSYNKNTAGQKFNVLAVNSVTGLPVTGDAANITAQISIDSGAFAAIADTNPTELDATNAAGVYVFDLSQAETNGNVLTIVTISATSNVQLDMLNIYTVVLSDYKADVSALATSASVAALNDFDPASDTVANVALVATTTANTDMRGTDGANTVTPNTIAPANSDISAIKTKTDQFVFTVTNQVDANSLTGGTSAAAIYTYFTTGTNEDAFKANVSSLALESSVAALPSVADIMASGDIDGYTLEEALKLCAAVLAGKVSGAGTTEITFRAVDDSKDRVVATVAGEGNRTSVTIDVTG